MLQAKNIATVIRIDNKYCSTNLPYAETIIGSKEIEVSLAGVSAGASAIAIILEEFYKLKKVLLVAPADSVNKENVVRGLRNYAREIYLVAGADDEIGTGEIAKFCFDESNSATKKTT
jgi:esterase/lipase